MGTDRYRFVWNSVPMGTDRYREKKMATGLTMAKEQTTILCQVSMLKKTFTRSKLSFPAENLDR
jgi:hypothetical protein